MSRSTTNEASIEKTDAKEEYPDAAVIQLVHSYGYPLEVFRDLETDDEYLLDIYRMPHGKANQASGTESRPVVLLVHGLIASAADFILMGPKRGLAYILADRGYDVWIGNYRGSMFSRKHKVLDPEVDKKYWNFSFHEIGIYDLPAILKQIVKTTGCKQLSYIAISQGTSSLFVLLSEKPEYNDIFNIVICMAPIHSIPDLPSPIISYLTKHPGIWEVPVGIWDLFSFPPAPWIKLIKYIGRHYCQTPGVIQNLVAHIMFIVCGYDHDQLNKNELPTILEYIPNPTSVVHYRHFSQTAITGEFRKLDLGQEDNLKHYGQDIAPLYDFSKITSPVAIFHSTGDWISGTKDVERLKQALPNVVLHHVIEHRQFNHLDFSYAVDVADLLYNHTVDVLDKYNS